MIDFANRKVRRIALCVGVSVLGLGGFGYGSYEAHGKTEALKEEAAALESKIASARREIAQARKLEESVLRLRSQVQNQVRILPDDAEINEFVQKLTQFADSSGVRINKLDDSALQQRNARKGAGNEPFDKITYKLDLAASSNDLLAFLDAFENRYERFVRITNFRVRTDSNYEKRAEEGEYEAEHQVTLELETYVYNPRARGSEPTKIPDEEKKLEALVRAGRIDPETTDITIERFEFVPRADRRDAFVDPRILKSKADKEREERLSAEAAELDDLLAAWAEVQRLSSEEEKATDKVRLLQAQEATDVVLRSLKDRLQKHEQEKSFQLEESITRYQAELKGPLMKMVASRGPAVYDSSKRVVYELRQILERLRGASSARDHARVIKVAGEVDALRGLAKGVAEVDTLVQEIDALRKEAQVVTEFDSIELKFGGSIVRRGEDGRSIVILNGKSFAVGEEVQGDLRLVEVTKEALHFDFRGVRVLRPLGETKP